MGKTEIFFFVINATIWLCDFVGEDSLFTIYHLQLDVSFLSFPVTDWESNEANIASLVNIGAVSVVKYGADYGVKLASDFVDTARDDEHFQNVLQIMEQDRRAAPNLRHKNSTVSSNHNME